MSWTNYTVQINVRVSIHDECEFSADNLVGEATRRLADRVESEVALMQETAPEGAEIEMS